MLSGGTLAATGLIIFAMELSQYIATVKMHKSHYSSHAAPGIHQPVAYTPPAVPGVHGVRHTSYLEHGSFPTHRILLAVSHAVEPERPRPLGLNLYSNIPAVIFEVVANSWDADATTVTMDIDRDSGRITVRDDGIGIRRAISTTASS